MQKTTSKSIIKRLLSTAKLVEDKKDSKGPITDGIEVYPCGYFSGRTARGKRWTWEKAQMKNTNRKIRYSKIKIEE